MHPRTINKISDAVVTTSEFFCTLEEGKGGKEAQKSAVESGEVREPRTCHNKSGWFTH